MTPTHFIRTARKLARGRGGKPQQVDLRRAVSTAYYALFHCAAKAYADALIGTARTRNNLAWKQAYRSLVHAQVARCCNRKEIMEQFSPEIQEFAHVFSLLQSKRYDADYDPSETFHRSEVLKDIKDAENAITNFKEAKLYERKAFVTFATTNFRKL
ncbi:MAG: hypothetical protein OXI05_10300 [Bacteroidota bacterium]|nr:hypothetical protein [Bacteroidota bacterium]MXW33676.1 hypothetical protein [Rhodothermaceae bacterium]MYJ19930.1 hypothetical protein [Rhodothermaceae bacterium]